MKVNFISSENIDKKLKKQLNKICKTTMKVLNQKHSILEVNLAFVTEEEIQKLNNEKRQVNSVTDVLSFPNLDNVYNQKITKKKYKLEINPDTKKVFLGDIVICLEVANAQAEEFGHSINREICYLTTHGLLHLMGYDHMQENEKVIMRSLEETVLTKNKLARI